MKPLYCSRDAADGVRSDTKNVDRIELPGERMFGDENATVQSLRSFLLHGLTFWDIAVEFEGGRVEEARLGAESVPEGLQIGDRVLVRKAAMMIVGLERIR